MSRDDIRLIETLNYYRLEKFEREYYKIEFEFPSKHIFSWIKMLNKVEVNSCELKIKQGNRLDGIEDDDSYLLFEEFIYYFNRWSVDDEKVRYIIICSSNFLLLVIYKISQITVSKNEIEKDVLDFKDKPVKFDISEIELKRSLDHCRKVILMGQQGPIKVHWDKFEKLDMLTQCVTEYKVINTEESVNFILTVPKKFESDWRRKLSEIKCTGKECHDAQEFF